MTLIKEKNKLRDKCIRCGKMFDDNYTDKTLLNKRIWCNSCIDKYRKELAEVGK